MLTRAHPPPAAGQERREWLFLSAELAEPASVSLTASELGAAAGDSGTDYSHTFRGDAAENAEMAAMTRTTGCDKVEGEA